MSASLEDLENLVSMGYFLRLCVCHLWASWLLSNRAAVTHS